MTLGVRNGTAPVMKAQLWARPPFASRGATDASGESSELIDSADRFPKNVSDFDRGMFRTLGANILLARMIGANLLLARVSRSPSDAAQQIGASNRRG